MVKLLFHLYPYLNRIEGGVASNVEGSIKDIKIDSCKLSWDDQNLVIVNLEHNPLVTQCKVSKRCRIPYVCVQWVATRENLRRERKKGKWCDLKTDSADQCVGDKWYFNFCSKAGLRCYESPTDCADIGLSHLTSLKPSPVSNCTTMWELYTPTEK